MLELIILVIILGVLFLLGIFFQVHKMHQLNSSISALQDILQTLAEEEEAESE